MTLSFALTSKLQILTLPNPFPVMLLKQEAICRPRETLIKVQKTDSKHIIHPKRSCPRFQHLGADFQNRSQRIERFASASNPVCKRFPDIHDMKKATRKQPYSKPTRQTLNHQSPALKTSSSPMLYMNPTVPYRDFCITASRPLSWSISMLMIAVEL